MNWGTKIVISFICFIGVIFTLVFISMKQDVSLVADDYYEQELAYEDQIQRIKNNNEIGGNIDFKLDRQSLIGKFTYAEAIKTQFTSGTIQFFRPSNSRLDKEFEMSVDEQGIQEIDMEGFHVGFWRVKISWKSEDKEFYKEFSVVL